MPAVILLVCMKPQLPPEMSYEREIPGKKNLYSAHKANCFECVLVIEDDSHEHINMMAKWIWAVLNVSRTVNDTV